MKNKYILLIATLLVCSISVWGQTKKNTSANSTKAIAEKVQNLETNTQELFSQLQNENKALKEQLQKMESDIALYREDVRTKVSEINSNLSDWLTLLSVFIGLMATALGVVAPLLLNYFNDKKQESKINEIQKKIDETKADAKSAKDALSDVEKLKVDITSIKQTIEESEKAAKKSAEEAQASKLFAEALAEKNPQKAIELYTEVIKCDNEDGSAYNNRANLYKSEGKTNEAMDDYNKAIELEPDNANIYHNRGNLYNILNKIDEAIADYSKAIELDPNNDYAYNGRADLYLKLQLYDKALEDINRALSLDDKEYTHVYHITKGEIYMAMKEFLDAINELTLAISLKDDVKEAYKYRGECYRELAKVTSDEEKKGEYNALAEADEKKYEELDKKSNG